jgi:DNA-binding NarL/FixJ family response regulator
VEHLINALTHTNQIHLNNGDGMPLLTRREEEVVRLVADGLKNREIAEELRVKEHSIRNYIYRIFDKVGVSSRVELILYAFSHNNQAG